MGPKYEPYTYMDPLGLVLSCVLKGLIGSMLRVYYQGIKPIMLLLADGSYVPNKGWLVGIIFGEYVIPALIRAVCSGHTSANCVFSLLECLSS